MGGALRCSLKQNSLEMEAPEDILEQSFSFDARSGTVRDGIPSSLAPCHGPEIPPAISHSVLAAWKLLHREILASQGVARPVSTTNTFWSGANFFTMELLPFERCSEDGKAISRGSSLLKDASQHLTTDQILFDTHLTLCSTFKLTCLHTNTKGDQVHLPTSLRQVQITPLTTRNGSTQSIMATA